MKSKKNNEISKDTRLNYTLMSSLTLFIFNVVLIMIPFFITGITEFVLIIRIILWSLSFIMFIFSSIMVYRHIFPMLILKLREKQLKSIIKIQLMTFDSKLNVLYLRPNSKDFDIGKETYVVDLKYSYHDGNTHNLFYIQGYPSPVKWELKDTVKKWNQAIAEVNNDIDSVYTMDSEKFAALVTLSHSSETLQAYKNDKFLENFHRSDRTDGTIKLLIGVLGLCFLCCLGIVSVITFFG